MMGQTAIVAIKHVCNVQALMIIIVINAKAQLE